MDTKTVQLVGAGRRPARRGWAASFEPLYSVTENIGNET